jgi:hypothetical protein
LSFPGDAIHPDGLLDAIGGASGVVVPSATGEDYNEDEECWWPVPTLFHDPESTPEPTVNVREETAKVVMTVERAY